MKIQWMNEFTGIANNFGYYTHQCRLMEAMQKQGIEITTDADITMSITTPPHFEPVKNKYNILYTMYEGETIPSDWIEPISRADMVIVPSKHNLKIFAEQIPGINIYYCPEGVDIDNYTYHKRKKTNKFVWLWVGATNPRKGICHIKVSWDNFKKQHPEKYKNSVLIMKTTRENAKRELMHVPEKNLWVDNRVLPIENDQKLPSLVSLYHFANAFLFPSMGEGFGLTLAEAASTGLPCIYTPYSSMLDYMDDSTGYPIDYALDTYTVHDVDDDLGKNLIHATKFANPSVQSIIDNMADIYDNYNIALECGKRASERIQRKYTWENSAKKLIEIIERQI